MKIICISGHAQHGKDTFAGMLSDVYKERCKRVLITHYADLLKYICKAFWGWNGEKDAAGRTLLQKIGTDVFRKNDPDFWVRFMVEVLGFAGENWDYVIIPDCRFPNEIDVLKEKGFDVNHIQIVRQGFMSPLSAEQQNHPSETALDDVVPDIKVYNNGTLLDLYGSAITIASNI